MSSWIKVLLLVLLLQGCAAAPVQDAMGLGWGYKEAIDYDDINQG